MPSSLRGIGLVLALVVVANTAGAEVFASKNEALAQAFPGADSIEHHTLVLDDAQSASVEQRARARLESRLATIHTGLKDGKIIGYAIIDVHTVRTLPEAFMVVLTPDGEVAFTRILAFYEPQEYMPPERWLHQFEHQRLNDALSLGGEIHGISGATLSSRAITNGVRRALSLFETFLTQRLSSATAENQNIVDVTAAGAGG